jgi:hypothetical protein
LHHAITVRLTKTNFLLWRAQLLPFLHSARLMGYVDGSTPAPPKQVPSSTVEGAELVSNPAYDRWDWDDQDQLLLIGLLSSLTEDILCEVITTKTA